MAYFPNGTSGMDWESENCNQCVHMYDAEGEAYACPIINVHYEHNYDQCADTELGKAIRKILDELIPSDERGFPERCPTFQPQQPTGKEKEYAKHLQAGKKPLDFEIA